MARVGVAQPQHERRPLGAGAEERFAGTRMYERLASAGEMGRLTVRSARQLTIRPNEFAGKAVEAYSVSARRMIIPLIISMVAFSIAYPIFFYGGLVSALGVSERLTSAVYIATAREIGVWITTMVLAGVAGSAIAADLASRKIREELDALSVLGVNVTRQLVVPRVLALVVLCPTMGFIALFFENLTTVLVAPQQLDYPLDIAMFDMVSSIYSYDLIAYTIKLTIYGAFVAIVACQKGLGAKGGSEGVGRAVNETVVIAFFGSWLLNSLYNLAYLTLFPQVSIFHG